MPLHRYRPLAYPCFKRRCAELAGLAWILFEQSQSLKHSLELVLFQQLGANLTFKQLLKGLSVYLKNEAWEQPWASLSKQFCNFHTCSSLGFISFRFIHAQIKSRYKFQPSSTRWSNGKSSPPLKKQYENEKHHLFYHCTHPFLHLLRHRSRYSMVTSAFSFGRANGVQETCTHSVRVTWWSTPISPVVSSCDPLLGQIGMKSSRRSLTGSSGRDHSWFTHACSCLVLQSTHRLMNCELSVVFNHARFPQGPFFSFRILGSATSTLSNQPWLVRHVYISDEIDNHRSY